MSPEPGPSRWQAAPFLPWPSDISHADAKWRAAQRLAGIARDGEVIGIGSGSSAYLSLWAIAERARDEDLSVKVATTSQETELAASTLGLPLVRLGLGPLSWIVDGADEVDPAGRFLKGRGGALFKEKLLWSSCDRRYVVIDATKRVQRLGSRFPVPIEVHPNAVQHLVTFLTRNGSREASLRCGSGKDGPVITESGFLLVDAHFDDIPPGLHAEIKRLPGVLETGIFEGYQADLVEDGGHD
jgi:ribose 5-phosphate isomerase A